MASNLKRIEEYLTRAGGTVQYMEHVLVVMMAVPDEDASVPFTVAVDELGPDLYRVGLETAFEMPEVPEEARVAMMSALPIVTSDLDVSRVAVLVAEMDEELLEGAGLQGDQGRTVDDALDPGVQTLDAELDADLGEPDPERVLVAATCYLPGLKPNHAKILLTYVQSFVEDAYSVRTRLEMLAASAPAMFGGYEEETEQGEDAGGAGPQGG